MATADALDTEHGEVRHLKSLRVAILICMQNIDLIFQTVRELRILMKFKMAAVTMFSLTRSCMRVTDGT